MQMERGARIIVEDWLNAGRDDVFHFITDEQHLAEAEAFTAAAQRAGAVTKLSVLDSGAVQLGQIVEDMRQIMSLANVVIGATGFSFITTNAVQYALKRGARFLSLPLATNDGSSLFESEFIAMSTREAGRMGRALSRALNRADTITAATAMGTEIRFSKKDRRAGYFNGTATRSRRIASASFEAYVPVMESSANGRVVLDGSLGYLGALSAPLELQFENGRLVHIADTADGRRLRDYLEQFNDPEMYRAAEFGLGTNRLARCRGASYIEDESSFGTFHIGFGRNLALGGSHDAEGHFDIVIHAPDVYADGRRIVSGGLPASWL